MLEAMSFVSEEYVEDAAAEPKRRRRRWPGIAAAAACLALVALAGAWRLTVTRDAAPMAAGNETAVFSAAPDDAMPVLGAAAKSAKPLEMTVAVTAQEGGALHCTVIDPGTGGFEVGSEITVLLAQNDSDTAADTLPARLRISFIREDEATVTALDWTEAE